MWHASRGCPQHVQIVHFAEQILHMLQVVAPGLVLHGQKILDDIAKALDADPQSMKRHLGPVAQGAIVQFARGRPALQSKMLEHRAARPDARRTQRQGLAPLPPLLAVEFFERRASFALLLSFAPFQNFEQAVAGIVRWALGRFDAEDCVRRVPRIRRRLAARTILSHPLPAGLG